MSKFWHWLNIFIVVLAILGCCSYVIRQKEAATRRQEQIVKMKRQKRLRNAKQKKAKKRKSEITATYFLHGAQSNSHAEQYMVNGALQAKAADQVINVNVSMTDQVTFYGSFTKKAKHPIIEVNYQRNTSVHPNDVKAVLLAVERKYGYHRANLVGHSMGNLLIANYLNDYYKDKKLPRIEKLVSIAGDYNGWLGESPASDSPLKKNGQPLHESNTFKQLLGLRKHYPRQIKVLNIYGNLENGTHSDGLVAISSARCYRYLINDRAKSYREIEIKGPNAGHSHLHHNPLVNHFLIKFLW